MALLRAEIAAAAAVDDRARSAASSLGTGEIVLTARELAGVLAAETRDRAWVLATGVAAIESGKRLPTIRTLIRVVEGAGLELVVGLRRPGADQPVVLGALVSNADDGLADFLPLRAPSPFDGPPDR